MANEFVARNGVIALNNSQITGSLIVTDGITGSLFGTSSWAINTITATTASYFITSSVTSASYAESASLTTNVVGQANRILFNSGDNTTTTSNNLTWTDNINLLTLGDATGTAGTISKIALYTSSYGGYGLGVSPAQLDYVSDGSHVFYKNGITPTELLRIINNGDIYAIGDLYNTGSIKSNGFNSYLTGSLQGTASYALTASYASNVPETASFAISASQAITASYVTPLNQNVLLTGSLTSTATITANKFVFTNSVVNQNNLGQNIYATDSDILYLYTGTSGLRINNQENTLTLVTLTNSGNLSVPGGFTGSLQGNATSATTATSSSYAATASYADNFIVKGTLTAQTLNVQTVSSSVVYSSGSNVFGNQLSNTQQFTGSVTVTGSLAVNGLTTVNGSQLITGSLTVGSSSLGPDENTLTLGARDAGGEGGQLGLNASGGTYTSASMLDNYQNSFRVLTGTNAGSSRMDLELSHVTQNLRIFGDVIAYAASDKRLKKNIKPIENALDILSKIGGYTFDWDENFANIHGHEGEDIGVVAQEFENALPILVNTRDNGYKAVNYEKIVALLIQVDKEQQKIIEDQQRQINELRELINIYIKTK